MIDKIASSVLNVPDERIIKKKLVSAVAAQTGGTSEVYRIEVQGNYGTADVYVTLEKLQFKARAEFEFRGGKLRYDIVFPSITLTEDGTFKKLV